MNLAPKIAARLGLPKAKVEKTIELLAEENTIPFIARYRKEITGNLDEVQIKAIQDELNRLSSLEERRKTILETIEGQGKLTSDLRKKILKVESLSALEDLYLPYRPKRHTRAMLAREKGLEPLALMIIDQATGDVNLKHLVRPFISEKVPDQAEALSGAEDIVADMINDHAEIRGAIRQKTAEFGSISARRLPTSSDPLQQFEIYYDFHQAVKHLQPHQVLAINRGEHERILKVHIDLPERDWRSVILQYFPAKRSSVFYDSLNRAIDDCAARLLLPSIERDIRRRLTEQAEDHAIQVFATNLHALLTQPPIADHTILAIDPGFRTGSKIAVLDPTGKVLETGTIYPHPPHNQRTEAYRVVQHILQKHRVSLVVIGNGTASRETEYFISEITSQTDNIQYLITSEAGASVYSASQEARSEFPDLDVSIRGAVSIGRRVIDPLAELVKIDPKAIGVGLYQHDINQTRLSAALDQVVASVVNQVGVEVNTSSAALLTHVSGIGPKLAERIVHYREIKGMFLNRQELISVPGFGAKTFEQSAGFLRIRNGNQPLDATAIHPESYPLARKILSRLFLSPDSSPQERLEAVNQFKERIDIENFAEELQAGLPTLQDILDEIAHPGRDPREGLPKPLLRKDVLTMKDLQQGMTIMGTIRNVVDFGAFVDIGVKTDGLLHRSQIIKGAHLKVGDILPVTILDVDPERHRISLSMKESLVE